MHLQLALEQLFRRRGKGTRVRKAMARRNARASAEFEKLLAILRYEAPSLICSAWPKSSQS